MAAQLTHMAGRRSSWTSPLVRPLLCASFAIAFLGAAAAAASLADTQCEAGSGDPLCPGLVVKETVPEQSDGMPAVEMQTVSASTPEDSTLQVSRNSSDKALRREELGYFRLGFVLVWLLGVLAWIGMTIKFAVDGSLPARVALWGLLPEAYAAISVRAVAALLRLKKGTTPVRVLRNCVTDAGAAELAQALRLYGKSADLQVVELPHNPKMGKDGLGHIVAAAMLEDSQLQELDFSYNPQLGDNGCAPLLPLVDSKASKINTLRLADCSLTLAFIEQLAAKATRSKLRMLDLSCNNFSGTGELLAEICEAPVLEELQLMRCGLSVSDVEALADQLPYTSIRALQLGGNRFGNTGLLALTRNLPSSQIDELGLEGNEIEAGSLASLGSAWAKRPFSRVRLDGNRMSQAEVAAFVRTLRSIH